MSRFSSEVTETLEGAGWTAGRTAPELVERWRSAHVPRVMASSVKRALLEFGGLTAKHPDAPATAENYRKAAAEGRGTLVIDPDQCGLGHPVMEELAHKAGESGVYPIGRMGAGDVALAMGDSGCVFAVQEGKPMRCMGRSIDEAVATILSGEPGFEI